MLAQKSTYGGAEFWALNKTPNQHIVVLNKTAEEPGQQP